MNIGQMTEALGSPPLKTEAQLLREEIERLKKRLEIDDEAAGWDGIACRDETIKLQDEKIERLTKELDAYCEKWHKELALGDELRQQLSAAVTHGAELMRGREGWQPIETAPKDGTDILVMYMHIDTQIVHNAFWNEYEDCDDSETGWWSYEHSEVSRIKLDDWMTPTHWMPLPAAPKPGEKE